MVQYANLSAAADFMGPGAIELPEFQKEITDLVRRAGVLGQRISYVPSPGGISRFFEETAIADGQWTDKRSIAATATEPTRVEKSALIKAITNQINYGLFDQLTVAQTGVFTQLKAKDMSDMVNGILRLRDKGLWTGSDTVSGAQIGGGVAGNNEYVGILNQVQNTTTIASGSSIVDAIREDVANMLADQNFDFAPSAIYMHPLAVNKLEEEIKNSTGAQRFIATDFSEVKAGLSVRGIFTAAGYLPVIPEPFLTKNASVGATPIAAAPAGQDNYPYAILSESLVEFHHVGGTQPKVYQLGKTGELDEKYVGVLFGSPVVKYRDQDAHRVGVIQF